MKNEGITRRDCLALLGTGAATLLSSTAKGQAAATHPQQQALNPGSAGGVQSTIEELKELDSSLVFSTTPVQSRSEYGATPQTGIGCAQMTFRDGWEMAEADMRLSPGRYASDSRWVKVEMPRPVQFALMEAGEIENLWSGENFKDLQWVQQRDWHFRRRFRIPEEWKDSVIRLQFDGMDYVGMVWLDGEFLGAHEGAFGGPTFDITDRVAPGTEHELLVRLVHEPHDLLPNYDSQSENRNPRVVKPDAQDAESYQWGNRYRTIGLYQTVRLIATGKAYLEIPFVRTDSLSGDSADLWAQAMLTNTSESFEGLIQARIVEAKSGEVSWQKDYSQTVPQGYSFWEQSIRLPNPKLWWPNGLGEQPLYRLELSLLKNKETLDRIDTRFGVRTLELKRNPSTPESPRKTTADQTLEDEAYRYLWVANGRPFYVKGACWMTSDDVLALSAEREEWMVRAAKEAGFNLLRLNGGTSIFETEQFYNLCDEHGMLVWQEVPLNWADSPGTTKLSVWREQLTQTVLRVRQHPSIGIYVGGNEYDPFADGIEPLLGLIREIFAAFDGDRPFRMNSPCGGDYHAYEPQSIYTADENWYHKIFDRGHYFISEWSFSSFANLSLLKRFIPAEELERKPVGYDVEVFKRHYPTIRDRSAELNYTFVKSWQRATWYADFGNADVDRLIHCSQMGYEHNIGCVLEQWRAQFPYTGGEALWTYNSLGPVANSWHIIDWCGQPQIPFYAAKRANEPFHVMADAGFFSWGPGDTFQASIFALNDQDQPLQGAAIRARILDRQLKQVLQDQWTVDVPPNNRSSEAHNIHWPIPAGAPEGYHFLELTLTDHSGARLSRRVYWLRVLQMLADPTFRKQWQAGPVAEPLTRTGPWLIPQVERIPTKIQGEAKLRKQSDKEAEIVLKVRNAGDVPGYPLSVEILPDVYSAIWSDNYFWLAPGEEASLNGTVRLNMKGLDPIASPPIVSPSDLTLRISSWNAEPRDLRLGGAKS